MGSLVQRHDNIYRLIMSLPVVVLTDSVGLNPVVFCSYLLLQGFALFKVYTILLAREKILEDIELVAFAALKKSSSFIITVLRNIGRNAISLPDYNQSSQLR
ncbi:unnamed protein product [Dovyalis caffra]|uniref:Uncharacterized protein n=1 Tax=Dovyalis caffra TaxID=77055 RepID=A0AAV1QQU0_9ROSI|nr:unnamed protein product [Dovyalis caffra]